MTTLSITEARKNLPNLVDRASNNLEEFTILKNGKVQAVLMSAEEFESWKETIEIMSDKKLMEDIRKGEADIKAGRVVSAEEVFKCIE